MPLISTLRGKAIDKLVNHREIVTSKIDKEPRHIESYNSRDLRGVRMREEMAIDGIWNVIVSSPLGEQKSSLELRSDGETLIGTGTGPEGALAIKGGRLEGDKFSWKLGVTSPFPMTLEFGGTCSGDTISGQVKAGMVGSFPFVGTRA